MGLGSGLMVADVAGGFAVQCSIPATFKLFPGKPAFLKFVLRQCIREKNGEETTLAVLL